MPAPDKPAVVAREWIAKAENDLKNAAHTLKLGADCPTDTVCFHAQQCVEKLMKAAVIAEGEIPPKTHDLTVLSALLTSVDPRRRGIRTEEFEASGCNRHLAGLNAALRLNPMSIVAESSR